MLCYSDYDVFKPLYTSRILSPAITLDSPCPQTSLLTDRFLSLQTDFYTYRQISILADRFGETQILRISCKRKQLTQIRDLTAGSKLTGMYLFHYPRLSAVKQPFLIRQCKVNAKIFKNKTIAHIYSIKYEVFTFFSIIVS